ncbi:PEGA domain-containing protein [Melittangium boletus]|uniref:PEGA domain-containing protein n=1 Tax=Melittangium boletus TaxID=83453 RepID=UPI003DA4421A
MTFSSLSSSMVWALAFVLGGTALAAPRRAVFASGDCKDATLSSQTQALAQALAARPGQEVLTAAEVTERLLPQPTGSLEDIRRRFEAAQGQFYEAQYTRSALTLDDVLRQVARLPGGEARWRLAVDAWLLQGMTLRSLGRVKESDDAFRHVLSLDPLHPLDPDYYTPSTRQAFEKLRKELARAPKVRLSVKSTLPASEVFLDGRSVGPTPLVLEVPPGTYSLTLQKDGARSFPRQLEARGEELPLLVDLAHEGAFSAEPLPCIATAGEGERGLSHAVRLGGTLGAEEVIVVRLEGASSGPKWLAATVMNVEGGQKLREGGFKTQGLEAPAEALGALVDFITTGKTQPSLVVARPDLQPPWEKTAEARPPPPLEVKAAPGVSGARVASYVALGTGVAALAGAGGVRLSAEADWRQLQRGHLNAQGRVEAGDVEGRALVRRLEGKGQWLTGLLVGSGVALATGAVLYLAAPTPEPLTVGVLAGPEGVGASLSGRF